MCHPCYAPAVGAGARVCPDGVRHFGGTLGQVSDRQLLEEFRRRLSEAVRSSPAQDLEKNLHALLGAFFDRFDLASREELEVQKTLLERAQAKLAALEARIAELQRKR